MVNSVIEVANLTKTYGSTTAVNNLSFEVEKGTIFAFLGTNGAGKSTTINCITTTLGFDKGNIQVTGLTVSKDNNKICKKIGVVFQQSLLDPTLSVTQNLYIRAGFYGLNKTESTKRINVLSKLVGLETFLHQPVYGKLSGGQKRRADIARALIHQPEILFLDEPTAGLDPQSREQVWETIHKLRKENGLTVFLTTHYMEETEKADQVCIINAGIFVTQNTPSLLRQKYSKSILSVTTDAKNFINNYCSQNNLHIISHNNVYQVEVDSSEQAQNLLIQGEKNIIDFEFRHGNMDDVFLALTSTTSTHKE